MVTKLKIGAGARGGVLWHSFADAMDRRGYTELTLAQALSTDDDVVTERAVQAWLVGERTPPLPKFERVLDLLGKKADDLLKDRPRR